MKDFRSINLVIGVFEAIFKVLANRVLTARFSMLVNGSPVSFFNSFYGLTQGDSLSSSLFVIVTDALG